MRRVLARLAAATAIVVVVVLGALLALLPGAGGDRAYSVHSQRSDGLFALFRLCEALGFPARAWSAAPGELAGPGSLLVVVDAPPAPPPGPPRDAPEDGAAAPARSRDLAHYRRFLDEGGTLLALGVGDEELDFLRGLGIDLGALEVRRGARAAPLRLADGEVLELETSRAFAGVVPEWRVLAHDPGGAPVVVALPWSAGTVALSTLGAGVLTNKDLDDDSAPAVLFVRLLEALGPCERVLFDEYALGAWQPPSAAALAFAPRTAWLGAHLFVLLALLAWRSLWSGPFPRDPEPLLATAPLARATGFARTLESAGRHALLARLLRRGVLERWCARAGLRLPPETLPGVSAGELAPEVLDRSLRALAGGDAELHARLVAAFTAPAADSAGLASLARALEGLAAELFPEERAVSARVERKSVGAAVGRSGSSSRP